MYNIDSKMEAALNEKLAGLAATGAQIIGREYWGDKPLTVNLDDLNLRLRP